MRTLTLGPGSQAVDADRLGLAAELTRAHVLDLELGGYPAPAHQVFRDQHPTLERAALGLDAGRRVDRVAAVHDVLLDIADLGGDDRPSVETGFERGDDSIARQVSGLLLVDALGHEEDAAQTVALAQAVLDRPRHHRLVPDVLVN